LKSGILNVLKPPRPVLACTEIALALPLINLLTLCGRFLEKLTGFQIVKKFPAFYGS
jgi:hypothetical protein